MDRREFLRNTAVVAAGLALPKVVLSQSIDNPTRQRPNSLGFIARGVGYPRWAEKDPDWWKNEIHILRSIYRCKSEWFEAGRETPAWQLGWMKVQRLSSSLRHFPGPFYGYIDATRCPTLCRGILEQCSRIIEGEEPWLGLELGDPNLAAFTDDPDHFNIRIMSAWSSPLVSWWDVKHRRQIDAD